jgi:hypothetical protein
MSNGARMPAVVGCQLYEVVHEGLELPTISVGISVDSIEDYRM